MINNNKINVLIVDDEEDNLELYSDYLSQLFNYKTKTATSAKEAIEKLEQESFEIVVADMRMETVNSGFDVLDEINNKQLTTFVIILTANSSVEGCRKAYKNQAWDYISKTSDEYQPLEEVDRSIQAAKIHLEKWNGHREDKIWVENNKESLLKEYINHYIAVLHREVVVAEKTKKALIEGLLKRKISPYLAYIESFRLQLSLDKLTIFVEGPTDIKYLEKAIDIFGENELKNKINFDLVGDKSGRIGNGEKNMINAFSFLKENEDFRKDKKILLLFDNDIRDNKLPNKGHNHEDIYIDRMGDYLENNLGIKGIESFFDETLYNDGFKQGFIRKTTTNYNGKRIILYKIEQKMRFCEWVIEHKADKESFNEFQEIIKRIATYAF